MKEIKTEIEINADPEKVWKIITNVGNWQEWSPVINKSAVSATIGSRLSITMCSKEEGKDGPSYNPVITKLEAKKYFRWRAKMLAGFLFTNDKIFELEKTDHGTKVTHTESFGGLIVKFMGDHMDKGVPPILNKMNQALKKTAESS